MVIMRHIPKMDRATTRKQVLNVLIELPLILFDGNQVIGVLVHNCFYNLGLAADSIHRHEAARQFQQAQEWRKGAVILFGVSLP
jgi:hypothetical protein